MLLMCLQYSLILPKLLALRLDSISCPTLGCLNGVPEQLAQSLLWCPAPGIEQIASSHCSLRLGQLVRESLTKICFQVYARLVQAIPQKYSVL
jgi:hypothetical protein